AVMDEPEDVSPFRCVERKDTRCSDREAQSAIMGRLDEREPSAGRLCVVDTVTGIEVLAGHDLYPGAHIVEPFVDVFGELVIGGEPWPVVIGWTADVGHGHAMKGRS